VAFKLGKDIVAKGDDKEPGSVRQGKDFLSAIGLIAIADISMSLDNVLAVAGIARNNPVILVFGLIVSIACLGFGAKIVSGLLERWKWLNWAGVGLITAIAVELVFGVHAI
jgi:predicted tellurium resistance membrane protein TerC